MYLKFCAFLQNYTWRLDDPDNAMLFVEWYLISGEKGSLGWTIMAKIVVTISLHDNDIPIN